MNLKKLYKPFKEKPKHSKINAKKLKDFDYELLNRIVNRFYNDKVMTVLRNPSYYSNSTVKEYKKIQESLLRISESIELKYESENIDLIPTSW